MFNNQYFGNDYWERYYWFTGSITSVPIEFIQLFSIKSKVQFIGLASAKLSSPNAVSKVQTSNPYSNDA